MSDGRSEGGRVPLVFVHGVFFLNLSSYMGVLVPMEFTVLMASLQNAVRPQASPVAFSPRVDSSDCECYRAVHSEIVAFEARSQYL